MSKLDDFQSFHNSNSKVYTYFSKLTKLKIKRGAKSLKAMDIVNEIRRDKRVKTTTMKTGPKIDNNHVSFYARLFMKRNPEYNGIFKVRRLKDAPKSVSDIGRSRDAMAHDCDHY